MDKNQNNQTPNKNQINIGNLQNSKNKSYNEDQQDLNLSDTFNLEFGGEFFEEENKNKNHRNHNNDSRSHSNFKHTENSDPKEKREQKEQKVE